MGNNLKQSFLYFRVVLFLFLVELAMQLLYVCVCNAMNLTVRIGKEWSTVILSGVLSLCLQNTIQKGLI